MSPSTGSSPSPSSSHSFATALRCRECKREVGLEPLYVCDFCFGPLEIVYDYEAMRKTVSREGLKDPRLRRPSCSCLV